FNQAISSLFQEVDAIKKGGEVREQLASFATGAGIYDALFLKAGPAQDGTLEPGKITENIIMLVGPDQVETMLAQWLYEYVSFAPRRGGWRRARCSNRGSPKSPRYSGVRRDLDTRARRAAATMTRRAGARA